ncbi:MAG TPA: tautomerase family protein [Bacillota bacterium]
MPYIEVLVYGRRTSAQEKQDLFESITATVTRCLAVDRRQVRIAVQEWPGDCYFEGEPDDGGVDRR